MPTAALADEILLPGEGQVRALLSLGGNPATCIPDQLKTHEALRSLDLLVQMDVQMTPTARLAHYVIAPKLAFEMPGTTLVADFTSLYANGWGYAESYAQYTPALIEPPERSDTIEQWRFLFRLAQRLGLQLNVFPPLGDFGLGGSAPTPLDMTREPQSEELFAVIHADSRIPLEEVRRHAHGALFPDPPVYAAPKDAGWEGRLDVGNAAMMSDLLAETPRSVAEDEYPLRLVCRRMMHVMNSRSYAMPANRPRYNPAYIHPQELARHGIKTGDVIEITSSRAAILAIASADDTAREGTVSLSHGFGDAPEFDGDVRSIGSNPGRLIGNDDPYDPYSGQPRMSNIPVRIAPVLSGENPIVQPERSLP